MRGIGVFRHGLEVEPRQGLEDLLLVEVTLHPLERGLPLPLTERRIVGVARDRLREAFVPRPLYLRKCRALLLEGLRKESLPTPLHLFTTWGAISSPWSAFETGNRVCRRVIEFFRFQKSKRSQC